MKKIIPLLTVTYFLLFFSCAPTTSDEQTGQDNTEPKEEATATISSSPQLEWNEEHRNKALGEVYDIDFQSNEHSFYYYADQLEKGKAGSGTISWIVEQSSFLLHFVKQGVSRNANKEFKALSGFSLYNKEKEWGKKAADNFNHVNPKFVAWFSKNFDIKANTKLGNQTAQEIYDQKLKAMCRLLIVTHDYLEKQDIEAEQEAYLAKVKADLSNDDFSLLLTYLHEKYGTLFSPKDAHIPNMDSYSDLGSTFTPSAAIGFWLRRFKDGSEMELWVLLNRVMKEFDAGFEKEKQNYQYFYSEE